MKRLRTAHGRLGGLPAFVRLRSGKRDTMLLRPEEWNRPRSTNGFQLYDMLVLSKETPQKGTKAKQRDP